MTPKKQPTTDERTTFKGKSIATTGGILSPSGLNFNPIMEYTVFIPSQEAAADIHLPFAYEAQLLQMFADMREKIVK